MFLRKFKVKKSGRVHLSIVESYRDKEARISKTRTIKVLGYLDELENEYNDPISYFTEEAKKLTALKNTKKADLKLNINPETKLDYDRDTRYNLGYAVLSDIYHELGIDSFLKSRQRKYKFEYNTNNIMKLLVFSRLLTPESKKKTYENKDYFFENTKFSLDDMYNSLTFFNTINDDIQVHMNKKIKEVYNRDSSLVYYDVTNYYFESDFTDDFRKKGVSKEHRPNPIVQMGLFMDTDGIPIAYDLYPGNTNDSLTLRPGLSALRNKFELGKVIVVADKGMTTGDNINYILSGNNGYVLSMSVRKSKSNFKKYVLDQTEYISYGDDSMSKSRLEPREIRVTDVHGKKIKKTVHEKQVIIYSEKYAKKAKADRNKTIEKALELINSKGKYNHATSYGAAGYVKNLDIDKKTGEVLDNNKVLELDFEKVKEEEKLDGYYAIVTNEIELSNKKIVEIYRGLWKIEESFRITKSDLETRPVYVSRKDHINAHFLTCFIALTIARIVENRLNGKYSVSSILESLNKASCSHVDKNYYVFNYYDEILEDIGKEFNVDYSKKFMNLREIKNILANTKK